MAPCCLRSHGLASLNHEARRESDPLAGDAVPGCRRDGGVAGHHDRVGHESRIGLDRTAGCDAARAGSAGAARRPWRATWRLSPTTAGMFPLDDSGRQSAARAKRVNRRGSPLWYTDSLTNFALLYKVDGGWFLHDAPWRAHYRPGSNAVAGIPGGDDTGSHGCTNAPYQRMAQLFAWATVGTLVQVLP
jgi:hypothetical protein